MAKLTATHTYAELELSPAAYDEIAGKLKEAGYDHVFMDDGTIDMQGIGVTREDVARSSAETSEAKLLESVNIFEAAYWKAWREHNGTEPGAARVAGVEALVKVLSAPPQEAPQLIDTAPKDGSHILAWRIPVGIRVTNNTHPPTVVHWFDDPDEPGFYTSVNELAPEHPFNPTHWTPLPAGPSVSRPNRGSNGN